MPFYLIYFFKTLPILYIFTTFAFNLPKRARTDSIATACQCHESHTPPDTANEQEQTR